MTNLDEDTIYPLRSEERRRRLPMSDAKVYQEINAGRLSAVKIGNRTFISLAEIRRYIKEAPRVTGPRASA